MEMHQIRYFLAIARTLNFTRAAEECNVSQPALTRAIQYLEGELGGKLLRREGKLSHLTELGERMLPLVRQCYESAVAAKALASSLQKGATQVLTIALSHTVDLHLIAASLAELQRTFAGLQFRIVRGGSTEVYEALKQGQVEVAVAGFLTQEWDRLDSWPLFEEQIQLSVSSHHGLTQVANVEPSQLGAERLIILSTSESALADGRILEANGIRTADGHQVATQQDLKTLVQSGLGIGLLPQSAIVGTELRHVPVTGMEMSREVFLYAVAGRQRSPAGEALMKLLRARDWSGQIA